MVFIQFGKKPLKIRETSTKKMEENLKINRRNNKEKELSRMPNIQL